MRPKMFAILPPLVLAIGFVVKDQTTRTDGQERQTKFTGCLQSHSTLTKRAAGSALTIFRKSERRAPPKRLGWVALRSL